MEPKLIEALLDGLKKQANMLLDMNPEGEPFTKAAIDNIHATLKVVEKLEDFTTLQKEGQSGQGDEDLMIRNVLHEIDERIEQLARKRADAILLERGISCDAQKDSGKRHTLSASGAKTA